MKSTSKTSTTSWGHLFLLVGVFALFLFALISRITFGSSTTPVVLSDYIFENNTLITYIGSETEITLPTSYSLGETTEYKTGTVTFAQSYEAFTFMQENFYSGASGYYEFHNKIYTEAYPWTYSYNIPIPVYIEGDDYQITEMEWGCFEANTTIEKVYIPGSYTSVGVQAFYNCTTLKEVYIEEGVRLIQSMAFDGCINLEKVSLPNSIEQMQGYVFWETAIEEVVMPEKLKSITLGCFYKCSNLRTVKFQGTKVVNASYSDIYPPLGMCDRLENIFVPNALVEAYKADFVWSEYADFIIGY